MFECNVNVPRHVRSSWSPLYYNIYYINEKKRLDRTLHLKGPVEKAFG